MTTLRALLLREIDALHCSDHDAVLAKALGMIAGGCLWLLLIAHRISTRPKIGA